MKLLWYINGVVAAVAVIVLVTGLGGLAELPVPAKDQLSREARGRAEAGGGESGEQGEDVDSPLVAVARSFAGRWVPPTPVPPPPPIAPPSFRVTRVVVAETGAASENGDPGQIAKGGGTDIVVGSSEPNAPSEKSDEGIDIVADSGGSEMSVVDAEVDSQGPVVVESVVGGGGVAEGREDEEHVNRHSCGR